MGSQRLAILEYARKHDFRIDDFIEATDAGQASEKRRRLDELMRVLQRGDRLAVNDYSILLFKALYFHITTELCRILIFSMRAKVLGGSCVGLPIPLPRAT